MTSVIWTSAAAVYLLFWLWYARPRKKVTPEEADRLLAWLNTQEHAYSAEQLKGLRDFFVDDDGRDFVMVNLIHLKAPARESGRKLNQYQKVFLGALLRKAGHPVFIARRSGGNLELVNCEQNNDWPAAGMIRYRSRRDLLEMLPDTIGSAHHNLKLESLDKTVAFPASNWFIFGGPRVLAVLVVLLAACIAQLIAG